MESNFNNENFERFLRENSDQYRMYPSESVWRNIYSVLHTRRRWFGMGLILLLSAGFVTAIMMTNTSSVKNNTIARQISSPIPDATSSKDNTLLLKNPSATQNSGTKTGLYNQEPLISVIRTERSQPASPDNLPIGNELTGTPAETPTLVLDNAASSNLNDLVLNNLIATPATEKQTLPILLNIADQLTDQDNWNLKNETGTPAVEKMGTTASFNLQSANLPLSIESVINSYTRRSPKLSFQFYFTPTISYRKLSENKSYLRSGSSPTPADNNINNVVTHKPDMGLELGATARYSIAKKLRLRAGLQFNTSRYDIKAFSSPAEVTTIALNTGNYTADSVSTVSNYRNFNGYKTDWLHNFYFQISAPIGIEWRLAGDDKIQFGIAGTIQPTYILGDRAYLLSSNYKNYAEVPWLMRRWNMNTSLEAFVSYSTGKMNWQVGPQIRYQLQSSFVKEYPVRENLFDFGLKIGVSANR